MQDVLTAGDSLNFPVSAPGYSASEGWSLKYRLIPRTGTNAAIDITGVPAGDDFLVQEASTTTAAWAPDAYSWVSWVERGAESYSLKTGQCVVQPDPRQALPGTDLRSLPRKTLDDLLAARATWAASHGRTRSYKIGDRERVFATAAELDAEIRFWQGQLADEQAAERLAAGLPSRNRILVRFSRPR